MVFEVCTMILNYQTTIEHVIMFRHINSFKINVTLYISILEVLFYSKNKYHYLFYMSQILYVDD